MWKIIFQRIEKLNLSYIRSLSLFNELTRNVTTEVVYNYAAIIVHKYKPDKIVRF